MNVQQVKSADLYAGLHGCWLMIMGALHTHILRECNHKRQASKGKKQVTYIWVKLLNKAFTIYKSVIKLQKFHHTC